ncbi:MAG: hypothetical protein QXT14_05345 [Candidatus Bathyarchaeia archaeon]
MTLGYGFSNLASIHYAKPEVISEILEFSKNRWVAVYYTDGSFHRYTTYGSPLTLRSSEDLEKIRVSKGKHLRTIYASAKVYRKISIKEDLYDDENIMACTPSWDVDNTLSEWRTTVKAAEIILDFLRDMNVRESLYVKWSGEGCHIHIHEKSLSREMLSKFNPFDVAYAVVEYVILKTSPSLLELTNRSQNLKVENLMDPQRVFTCPLSLHRVLDVVCVCIAPSDLRKFEPSWIDPTSFKHYSAWKSFKEGELDQLAEKALTVVGPYPAKKRRVRKHPPLDKQILDTFRRLEKF